MAALRVVEFPIHILWFDPASAIAALIVTVDVSVAVQPKLVVTVTK